MISYEKCQAISNLVVELVATKDAIMNRKFTTSRYRASFEIFNDDIRIEFSIAGNCDIYQTSQSTDRLCSIMSDQCMFSLFERESVLVGSNTYQFYDHKNAVHDYYCKSFSLNHIKHPIWIGECTADNYDSVVFQLSTVYNEDMAGLMLLNNFIRPILEGTGFKFTAHSLLLQLPVETIECATLLLQKQHQKISRQGECK